MHYLERNKSRNLAFSVFVGQTEHSQDNYIIDTDSSLHKGTEVKYHEVSFELQANSCNWSIKGKTRDKAGNVEWDKILHRINILVSHLPRQILP